MQSNGWDHGGAPPPSGGYGRGGSRSPPPYRRGGPAGGRSPPRYRDEEPPRRDYPPPRERSPYRGGSGGEQRRYSRDESSRHYEERGGYRGGRYDDRERYEYSRGGGGGYGGSSRYEEERGGGRDYHRGGGYDRREYGDDRRGGGDYSRDRSYGGRGGEDRYAGGSRFASRPVVRGNDEERMASRTLFVGNLSYDFREEDAMEMFQPYGRIVKVTVPQDRITGRNKGFAFVEFENRRDGEDAFEKFQGALVGGRRLRIDWDVGLQKKDQVRGYATPSYRDGPPPPSGEGGYPPPSGPGGVRGGRSRSRSPVPMRGGPPPMEDNSMLPPPPPPAAAPLPADDPYYEDLYRSGRR